MQQRDPDDAAGDVQVPEVVGVADPTCRGMWVRVTIDQF
jgi:hypothetical protein